MIYNQYVVNSHTTDEKNKPQTDSWFYKISPIHYNQANEWMHKNNQTEQITYNATFTYHLLQQSNTSVSKVVS